MEKYYHTLQLLPLYHAEYHDSIMYSNSGWVAGFCVQANTTQEDRIS